MSRRVYVNPIACDAHGLCAELLPERIELDDWGYPIVDSTPLESHLVDLARRAAQACPTLALHLERNREPITPEIRGRATLIERFSRAD